MSFFFDLSCNHTHHKLPFGKESLVLLQDKYHCLPFRFVNSLSQIFFHTFIPHAQWTNQNQLLDMLACKFDPQFPLYDQFLSRLDAAHTCGRLCRAFGSHIGASSKVSTGGRENAKSFQYFIVPLPTATKPVLVRPSPLIHTIFSGQKCQLIKRAPVYIQFYLSKILHHGFCWTFLLVDWGCNRNQDNLLN